MKIKFLKPFRLYNPIGDDMMMAEGAIVNMEKEDYAQWLIDNGFAEKVEESVEWLHDGASYYQPAVNVLTKKFVPSYNEYWGDAPDEARRRAGICYKSRAACQRFIDFLTAVEVVSHDEGFMRKGDGGFGWPVIEFTANNPGVEDIAERQHAGEFYFDTREHALNSAMNHTREWQTILNYDWSKGEEEEDED